MGYTATELDALVSDFARALSRRIRVDRILLFGSHARGDAGPGSDIDLLVISPDFGRDVLRDMVLLRECLPDRTVDIDTIARTPEQVASAEPDSFLATILKDAVTVYPFRNS